MRSRLPGPVQFDGAASGFRANRIPVGGTLERDVDSVYEELRELATAYLLQQPPGHTLQPTALVHEAYVRLSGNGGAPRDRTHFLAVAARAMRQILVDHARRKTAQKRGGRGHRVTLDDPAMIADDRDVEVLALHEALEELAELDERKSRVVELRVFGGMTIDETAEALGVSGTTVSKDWRFARAWFARELEPE